MSNTIEYIPLRRNGRSLYLRVPASYVRANQLVPGDIVVWGSDGKLKIVKQSRLNDVPSQADDLEIVDQ